MASSQPLISSDRVEGTDVYSPTGKDKIGSIDHLMIDKQSGKVTYAVMHFGGFLGLGEKAYPLPWPALKYDTRLNGYVTNVTEEQVKQAPEYREARERDSWPDRDWETRLHQHYSVPPYWL
jgi:hypothetical protein